MISRNFENNVANDSILAASPNLLFSKNPEKAMENENILLSSRILHEVSPEKVFSPSSHRYQLSSTTIIALQSFANCLRTSNNELCPFDDGTALHDIMALYRIPAPHLHDFLVNLHEMTTASCHNDCNYH
ncbi:hypothetical protein GQX74_013732 [Glossina fuscipes]|nr:hypothetical protein GQX74_013732 [Glossina fuscipes]